MELQKNKLTKIIAIISIICIAFGIINLACVTTNCNASDKAINGVATADTDANKECYINIELKNRIFNVNGMGLKKNGSIELAFDINKDIYFFDLKYERISDVMAIETKIKILENISLKVSKKEYEVLKDKKNIEVSLFIFKRKYDIKNGNKIDIECSNNPKYDNVKDLSFFTDKPAKVDDDFILFLKKILFSNMDELNTMEKTLRIVIYSIIVIILIAIISLIIKFLNIILR